MPSTALSDTVAFKASTRDQWNAAASGWNAHGPAIRSWLRPATEAMCHLTEIRRGHHVLDIAAGAGDQTLDIAARVGPEGRVVATDISPAILSHAKANATNAGYHNVETIVADGEALGFEAGMFDAAICRLGLMFFPEPARGVAEMARILKPGGRAACLVFAGPETNPLIRILMSTALRHAGLPMRDPFAPGGLLSLGKADLVDALFVGAGFRDVATIRMAAPFHWPSSAHYVSFIKTSASPIHGIMASLPEDARQAAWDDMQSQFSAFDTGSGFVGPNELLLTVGRR